MLTTNDGSIIGLAWYPTVYLTEAWSHARMPLSRMRVANRLERRAALCLYADHLVATLG